MRYGANTSLFWIDGALEAATEVLDSQIMALKRVHSALDASFLEAVERVALCRGRVLVVGMGKSYVVSMKIAGTLSSLGVPSHALHAADALHGDLGTVTKSDLVVAISQSGDTPEVVQLASVARERGCYVIALTGVMTGDLALTASKVINSHVGADDELFGLVPTTSSLVMLAQGDALAAAVARVLGKCADDFRANHPGSHRPIPLVVDVTG